MNPYTDSELDAFGVLQTCIQGSHGSKHTQRSTDGSLCIIFMCVGIPKVHEESIT
jgi:hypothetical protein